MNRLTNRLLPGRSADAMRLWGLFAVFVMVSQFNESLSDATLTQHMWYWSVRFSIIFVALFGAQWLVDSALKDKLASPAWLKPVVLVSALAALPFAMVELYLESRLPVIPAHDDGELMARSPLLAYISEYVTVTSIIIPLHFLVWLLVERHREPGTNTSEIQVDMTPEFLSRTHGIKTGDVLALKAEEHYVLIYTADSNELIHYKFGTAIAQMPEAAGLQVHRSWWIADAHVANASRGSRRWQLTLTNGIDVPVSDGFVKVARERGLLKRKSRRPSA